MGISSVSFSQNCTDADCYSSPIRNECIDFCRSFAWQNILMNSEKKELKNVLDLNKGEIKKIINLRKSLPDSGNIPKYNEVDESIQQLIQGMNKETIQYFLLPSGSEDRKLKFQELKSN